MFIGSGQIMELLGPRPMKSSFFAGLPWIFSNRKGTVVDSRLRVKQVFWAFNMWDFS